MKRIAILGSTGSIGCSALSVVAHHPERLRVVGLAAGANATRLAEQVTRFQPSVVAMASEPVTAELRRALGTRWDGTDVAPAGRDGLLAVATQTDADIVICASSGTAALEAVLAAIEAGKTIALANKEILVMAGALMIDAARRSGVAILPVDSEHSAIHQCLHGRDLTELRRLILTASGGPFRRLSAHQLESVGPEAALRHPTWQMGRKITIDSATLMNKGLEVIEARWLFGVASDRVDVLVHPQSIVHSMVELCDGSLIAQLGVTDMRLPIQYALSYPDRWETSLPSLDLADSERLEFESPDQARFPCLRLAYRALEGAASLPVVLNAANEVAVASFLERRLSFPGIARLIEQVMEDPAASCPLASLDDVRQIDAWARARAAELAVSVVS